MQKETISRAILLILSVPHLDISGRGDTRRVNYARDMFCYFMHKMTDYTYNQIGREVGGRNKSTVMRSIKNIKRLSDVYPAVKEDIKRIAIIVKKEKVVC